MASFLGKLYHSSSSSNPLKSKEDTKQSLHVKRPEIQQDLHNRLHNGDSKKLCEKHLFEPLEFYCKKHESYLCIDCVKLEHDGPPCRVSTITDLQKPRINSTVFTETLKPIAAIINKCQELSTTLQSKVNKTHFSYRDIINDVKTFKQDINHETDELENFLKGELKAIEEQSNNDSCMTKEVVQESCANSSAHHSPKRTISDQEDDDLLLVLQPNTDMKNKKVSDDSVATCNTHVNQDDDDILLF